MDKCDHHFCFDCIKTWANQSNKCSMCRKVFHRINKVKFGKIISSVVVNERSPNFSSESFYEINFNRFLSYCEICNSVENENDMLVCDRCYYAVCHYQCDNLLQIPQGQWFCHGCR